MEYTHYWQIDIEADRLYAEERYNEALKLLDHASQQFPENLFDIVWYKACIYNQVQDDQECLNAIELLVNRGFTCPLDWEWFDPLRENARFRRLAEENQRLLAKARQNTKMEYQVYLPEGYAKDQKYPLFLALHGDGGGGNIEDFSRRWKPDGILEQGFIVAYIQSSQLLYTNNFGWLPDYSIARRDVRDCYDRVCAEYAIDQDTVIIGGYSGGAIMSLEITMADVLPIKGFVSLCPELKPESFTRENVERATKRGAKGIFMEGETMMPVPDEQEMLQVFQEVGFPHQFYVNKGIGHSFPQDLGEKLEQAITYIVR